MLMPDQAATLTTLNDSILDAALNVANGMQRPLSMREFAPYFTGRPTSLHLPTMLWYVPYLHVAQMSGLHCERAELSCTLDDGFPKQFGSVEASQGVLGFPARVTEALCSFT